MTAALSPLDLAKRAAALRAAEFVEPGMRVGLGTGSTAAFLVRRLGERVRDEGLRITAVATSSRTTALAREAGIAVSDLGVLRRLDLTVDGADEVDGQLQLIKGAGGALLQEKIVAAASDRVVIIADAGKRVETLGAFPLSVEVVRFAWPATKAMVEEALVGLDVLGRTSEVRMQGEAPLVTDEGHHILDLRLHRIGNPRQLSLVLNQVPGVVENGLFLDLCDALVVGHADGRVETREFGAAHAEETRVPPPEDGPADNIFTEIAD
jgi:ribose 5-phosphate isomerase A